MLSKQEQLIQYLINSLEGINRRMDRLDQILLTGTPPVAKRIPKRKRVSDGLDAMAEREVNKFINSLNQRYR